MVWSRAYIIKETEGHHLILGHYIPFRFVSPWPKR